MAMAQRKTQHSFKVLTIGQVKDLLADEFPDISPSKIRFYEDEGLIASERTSGGGHRRFSRDDVERLRFILTQKRDRHLPLKVIAEQLEASDAAGEHPNVRTLASKTLSAATSRTFLRKELCRIAEVSETFFTELSEFGLIPSSRQEHYSTEDLETVRAAKALAECGLHPRNLRVVRLAVERELDAIQRATLGGGTDSKGARALRERRQVATEAMLRLHSSILRREAGAD
ncbi:MerR family transcriptional regulator [Micrococcales bacterium 31B]|nr:MerR family transcriptional regulator [Micrococcales bacterium 31B]